MKKIFLSLIAVMATMSINAQTVKVYENGVLTAIYTNSSTQTVEVVFEKEPEPEPADANLIPGKFSVSSTKQVQFTKSNLYWNWDENTFKFEANQTDYPTEWVQTHVGHFFWSSTALASCCPEYNSYYCSASDNFFADGSDADHMLTVEGTSDLYVLSSAEWEYLINSRASSLHQYPVTVTNDGTSYNNCLIIAPDDFTGTLQSSYTLDEVNAAGLVCLPAAGGYFNHEVGFQNSGSSGLYLSSDPPHSCDPYPWLEEYTLYFSNDNISISSEGCECAYSLRLVK